MQDTKKENISQAEKDRIALMERLKNTKSTLNASSQNKTDSGELLSVVVKSTATFESD